LHHINHSINIFQFCILEKPPCQSTHSLSDALQASIVKMAQPIHPTLAPLPFHPAVGGATGRGNVAEQI
jgi:hypothetical protein